MSDFLAEGVLTPRQAAAYIDSTENTLRSMRCTGHGPAFHRTDDGFRIYYLKPDLDAYLADRPNRRRGRTGVTRRDP